MPPGSQPPNRPNAPPPGPGQSDDVDVEVRRETKIPKKYKVILHNDDFTTMEFVVEVLTRFFHKNETEAVHIMLNVHKKGRGIAGVYPRDVAETKVSDVMDHARNNGMPLLVTSEPE